MYREFADDVVLLKVGTETISVKTKKAEGSIATVLFLHGAGTSSGERVSYLTVPLAERGVSSAAIDFSGHGSSTGLLAESSLLKRTTEAREVLRLLQGPIAICGSSMGAHIAIRLLESTPVSTLILFCPAVYAPEAYTAQFNKGFSELIRQPRSWVRSETFRILHNFRGSLVIIVGEHDGVIPPDLPKMLYDAADQALQRELITIPGADHKIHAWLQCHREDTERIITAIKNHLDAGGSA